MSFPRADQAEGEPIAGQAPNRYGRTRSTCRMCGECDIGCNYGSKNTLDLTVLSAAERAGAEVRTRCQVCNIQPLASGGYRVEYVVHEPDREGQRTDTKNLIPKALSCRALVMAAGTLGSTYLLLRNRQRLPGLGAALGSGSRATATSSGCAWRRWDPQGLPRTMHASRGPVITGGVRVDDAADGGQGRGFYIEDAGYPRDVQLADRGGADGHPGRASRECSSTG